MFFSRVGLVGFGSGELKPSIDRVSQQDRVSAAGGVQRGAVVVVGEKVEGRGGERARAEGGGRVVVVTLGSSERASDVAAWFDTFGGWSASPTGPSCALLC